MTREEEIDILRSYLMFDKSNMQIDMALNMAIDALQDRQEGEWTKTVDGNGWNEWWVFKCPLCGATIVDEQSRSWKYNFCPSCGARMKGGAE